MKTTPPKWRGYGDSEESHSRKDMPPTQNVDLPLLAVRAAVGTINEEARTVEATVSTGAGVQRYDYRTGERYIEVLSLDPKHVRMGRLNSGAPVLDTHSGWSVRQMFGAVVENSGKILNARDMRATLLFSRRPDVEPFWIDVKDRILRNVSLGYLVHTYEEVRTAGRLPVRTAVDWEPHEVSMTPMNADAGAQVRSGKIETFPCVIVPRSAMVLGEGRDRSNRLRLAQARTRIA